MEEKHKNRFFAGKEIDVIGVVRAVLRERKLLLAFVVAFAVLGVVYALNQAKRYTAVVILAPEMSGMGMSASISDLASMVGVELGKGNSSVDAIYPEIYPDLFASTDFVVDLFDVPVRLQKSQVEKTYCKHLVQDSKIPFWKYPQVKLLEWIESLSAPEKGNGKVNTFQLTKFQDGICNAIRKNIGCQIDKGTNVITISVTDEDPLVAAIMADTLQNRLQEYITRYRTQKARNDLEYAQKICAEAKTQYMESMHKYASYSDANMDAMLQSVRSKQERLEDEMQLYYNTYASAVQKVETAKARVQERTPAFTIIQKASVPLKASSMPRSMMVLVFMVLGALCDAAWVLFLRDWVARRRKSGLTDHKTAE